VNRRNFLRTAAALVSLPASGLARQEDAAEGARFSLAHLTVLGCAPPEMTWIAARAGYDFVSYRIIHMGLPNEPNYELAGNPKMLRETKIALADTRLRLHDIELARIINGVDVASYLPALEVGAELGARRVISSVWVSDWNYTVDSLGRLCDLAATVGLSISLEFVTWSNAAALRDALALVRAVKRPNCGLLLDTLHLHRSRVQLEELDSIPRDWVHFVHLCDAPQVIPESTEEVIRTGREARLDPGEGAIDLAAILRRIPAIPYSLEVPNLDRVRRVGYEEHARLCLDHAKSYLRGHHATVAK
jgi:sugar phosphate isomerase/epimerase